MSCSYFPPQGHAASFVQVRLTTRSSGPAYSLRRRASGAPASMMCRLRAFGAYGRPPNASVRRLQMEEYSRSKVYLRLKGDALDPDEVTRLMGCKPAWALAKGAPIRWPSSREVFMAGTGQWSLEAADRLPADLDSQVAEILAPLSQDLDVWRELTAKFSVHMFCILIAAQSAEAKGLSSDSMAALVKKGIEVKFALFDERATAMSWHPDRR